MPTPHSSVHNSDTEDSFSHLLAQQPFSLVPRIIATHWLRSDEVAA